MQTVNYYIELFTRRDL